jgi:Fic family protein
MDLEQKYPHIKFQRNWEFTGNIQYYLGFIEALIKSIYLTPLLPEHYKKLMKVSLIKGAQSTTAIEGNTLSEGEIEEIIIGKKLPKSKEYQEIEVKNVIETLNYLKTEIVENNFNELITSGLIKKIHHMIAKNLGIYLDAVPGKFRTDNRTVGSYHCPDYNDVEKLINNLTNWLKSEFHYPDEQKIYNVIVQAIVTHVYIEWIHPFGDGNGRTGRMIEFYILLRGGIPDIASHILSNYYNETRPEYYRQLDNARHKRDLTEFIDYALLGLSDGLQKTLEIIQKSLFEITWQKLIYDKFSLRKDNIGREVFRRRRTLMLEIPLEIEVSIEDISLLTPKIAKVYADKSNRTILRDLNELMELELIKKIGKKYKANIGLLKGYLPESKMDKVIIKK